MLEIKNLTKKFGNKVAVDHLSLKVNDGEIYAFIGHNGAGKTTTLKAIAGIINFDEGEILVDGIDVVKNPMEAKKIISYLPDNPDLYEHLRGIDYLNFIADVYGVSQNDRKNRIEEYGKRLDILKDLPAVISSYSHGMKQKLAILSAMVHEPKIMLFDEPFVGLDPTSSHEFKLIMQEQCKKGNLIFYSTHVLEVAEKICTNVAIIKKGKLVVSGKMKEVLGMDSLENLFLELDENEKHI